MTKIYNDFAWGIIQPTTALYYFKKMEVFEVQSNFETLINNEESLNNAVALGTLIGFELGSLEDLKLEYYQVAKTTRQRNRYPFREWLDNKRELILNQI